MSDTIISISGLSKLYRIGAREKSDRNFREVVMDVALAPVKRLRGIMSLSRFRASTLAGESTPSSDEDTIWALRDVTFDIARGEVVGIIGRNGAGKTTLLKILSRITEPTKGSVRIAGRVASLLEVGTGFHPELTGRENIFLNGAILGMSKREIRSKFDEIVAFAEIDRFIDTPVKRYSSGMYVRLAFSVAAHLDPEVLLVDEVLAVGDASFQKKCLGKMGAVAQQGRTVLFVSHNMHAISLLCTRAVLLEQGRLVDEGPARHVVENYLSSGSQRSAQAAWTLDDAPGGDLAKLRSVRAMDDAGQAAYDIPIQRAITLEMEFWCLRKTQITPSFHLYNQHGLLLFSTANLHDEEWSDKECEPGLYRCSCVIPGGLLNDGRHYVHAYLSRDTDGLPYVHAPDVISFQVIDDGSGRGNYMQSWPGLVRPILPWQAERVGDLP